MTDPGSLFKMAERNILGDILDFDTQWQSPMWGDLVWGNMLLPPDDQPPPPTPALSTPAPSTRPSPLSASLTPTFTMPTPSIPASIPSALPTPATPASTTPAPPAPLAFSGKRKPERSGQLPLGGSRKALQAPRKKRKQEENNAPWEPWEDAIIIRGLKNGLRMQQISNTLPGVGRSKNAVKCRIKDGDLKRALKGAARAQYQARVPPYH